MSSGFFCKMDSIASGLRRVQKLFCLALLHVCVFCPKVIKRSKFMATLQNHDGTNFSSPKGKCEAFNNKIKCKNCSHYKREISQEATNWTCFCFPSLNCDFSEWDPLDSYDASMALILGCFRQLSTFCIFKFYLGEWYQKKKVKKITLNL